MAHNTVNEDLASNSDKTIKLDCESLNDVDVRPNFENRIQ